MKSIFTTLFLSGLVVILVACSSTPANAPKFVLEPSSTRVMASPSIDPGPTTTSKSATLTAQTVTNTATLESHTVTPFPDCVRLYYAEYAQFEIIGSSGQRVFVDIHDPVKLTSPVNEGDILLTTHTHWDHLNEDFQSTFPGSQLFVQTGILEMPSTNIRGIASAHNIGDRLKPVGGTNYIYVIEIGGLRIAHFGDIGQGKLTDEQITMLGAVDIAITQINNPYSEMNAENRKGTKLMEQVKPRLVVLTHLNLDTVKLVVTQWDGFFSQTSSARICESDLSQEGTQFLLMGEAVETMTKYVDLVKWRDQ